jgi:hypothetical protein
MRLIGNAIVSADRRTNPELRALIEKDGVFNMEEEMALIPSF